VCFIPLMRAPEGVQNGGQEWPLFRALSGYLFDSAKTAKMGVLSAQNSVSEVKVCVLGLFHSGDPNMQHVVPDI
jgi:hypothetical protein